MPVSPSAASVLRTNASASRPPVPLPTAMAAGWWVRTNCAKAALAWASWPSPWLMKMVTVSRYLPVADRAAHLQPVRSPGSTPMTARAPSGEVSSRLRRLSANTSTAP